MGYLGRLELYHPQDLQELADKSLVLFGLGTEGWSSYHFLRGLFPDKVLGLADQKDLKELDPAWQEVIASGQPVRLHLGGQSLGEIIQYEVIIKSPGIPPHLPVLQQAIQQGRLITSHTAIFFACCPGKIIGVTGTKGKSTTASLIHKILQTAGLPSYLVGNIGQPPLDHLSRSQRDTLFVYELSSFQLEGLRQSPHIAVLLSIFPEHLDYHRDLQNYLMAKQNIIRYQTERDYLVYHGDNPTVQQLIRGARALAFPFSLAQPVSPGCYLEGGSIHYSHGSGGGEQIIHRGQIRLVGTFNLQNVMAAVTVGKLLGLSREMITEALTTYQPLDYRLEPVGTYQGITFYDDPLATVPEATIAALEALGDAVQTLLLGGYDRQLDFSALGRHLLGSGVENLILFPVTGLYIWEAVCKNVSSARELPRAFFVDEMKEAVSLAYSYTNPGRICLHSPASASFGLFQDYRQRGDAFRHYVRQLGQG